MKRLLLLALLALPCFSASASAQTVAFVTEEYAPFNYRDGKVIKGATVEQVEKVMADIGVDYTLDVMPWARAFSLARTTPMTCVFATARPIGSACPDGTAPVFRAYNNGSARGIASNHRITTNRTAIEQVAGRGWIDEGIVMCAPR